MAGGESSGRSEQAGKTETDGKYWKNEDGRADKDKKSKGGRACKSEESKTGRACKEKKTEDGRADQDWKYKGRKTGDS